MQATGSRPPIMICGVCSCTAPLCGGAYYKDACALQATHRGPSARPKSFCGNAVKSNDVNGLLLCSNLPFLGALKRQSDALADTDAHRAKGPFESRFLELVDGRRGQACARHAERVPQRNRAAIWVHVLGVVGET